MSLARTSLLKKVDSVSLCGLNFLLQLWTQTAKQWTHLVIHESRGYPTVHDMLSKAFVRDAFNAQTDVCMRFAPFLELGHALNVSSAAAKDASVAEVLHEGSKTHAEDTDHDVRKCCRQLGRGQSLSTSRAKCFAGFNEVRPRVVCSHGDEEMRETFFGEHGQTISNFALLVSRGPGHRGRQHEGPSTIAFSPPFVAENLTVASTPCTDAAENSW
jgi:hypothetical protein